MRVVHVLPLSYGTTPRLIFKLKIDVVSERIKHADMASFYCERIRLWLEVYRYEICDHSRVFGESFISD